MKKFLVILLAYALLTSMVAGQQLMYPCDSIAPALRAGSKAVIRSKQVKITIKSDKQSEIENKIVITLLNEKAENLLLIAIPYDDLMQVSEIRATAWDESGKLMWNLQKYNIRDMRDFQGPEYLNDSRKKAFEIPSYNYPFTISYSYKVKVPNYYLSSQMFLQYDPEISVQQSGIQCVIPQELNFNYKALNLKNHIDSVRIGKKLFLTWQEEDLPAARQRDYAPPLIKTLPVVYTAPDNFDLKGYKGTFNSWQSYGKWINQLNEGRDVLDKEYADRAIALVKNIPLRKDKIKALYEYMQKNTRYFSISFGIGGIQPIPANEVAKNSYGDCKALSNYMKALLKAVGIESYYTLVKSGDNEYIQADFPSDQFDHIILCVPDNGELIWLECTSQTMPFNYLGSFTCDRDVLAATPDGGKLLHTPVYGLEFNKINTYSEILLRSSGDADVKMKYRQTGLKYDDLYAISESKPDIRKTWLAAQFENAAFEIKKEEYSFEKNTSVPVALANFEIHIRDLSARSQNRLYVTPSFISRASFIWDDPSEIEIETAYQQNDSVRIEIPLGYNTEFLPENKSITSKFGSYSRSISRNGKYIYYSNNLVINKAEYPKETYPEFYNFINEIALIDHQVLILKSVTN
jgi:transglutaminase-like putative cysteine protease